MVTPERCPIKRTMGNHSLHFKPALKSGENGVPMSPSFDQSNANVDKMVDMVYEKNAPMVDI